MAALPYRAAQHLFGHIAVVIGGRVHKPKIRVVVVDEEFPFPENSGKRIRSLNLLRRLAFEFDIMYVAHRNADDSEGRQAVLQLSKLGIGSRVIDRKVPPKSGLGFYGRLAANVLSPLPYSVASHASRQMRTALREIHESGSVDLWHCEWTPYLQLFGDTQLNPVVTTAHNIESLVWKRYYETEANFLIRWYIGHQWKKFMRFEQRALNRATRTIAVSRSDALLAKKWFRASAVDVVENGVDVERFRSGVHQRDPMQLIFVGGLDWRPNVDGIRCFLLSALPTIVAAFPHIQLHVVGRTPPAWLVDHVNRHENVVLHADVADVIPHLSAAGLMVVPLRIGGGSRLKILEAAANGLPVVSTRIGAEGLDLIHGEHLLTTEGVDEMSQVIVEAIQNYSSCQQMAAAARTFVEANHDWDLLAKKQAEIWRAALLHRK